MTIPRLVIHVTLDDFGCEQHAKFGRNGVSPGTASLPFLDKLWDEGVRFENHFAESFCSPYRACHMTGRHTEDTGIGDIIETDADNPLLLSELLIPEILRAYYGAEIEMAVLGKWHLGTEAVGGRKAALDAGFDYAFTTIRNADYFSTSMECMGEEYLPLGRYIPDVLGNAALTWLRRFAARKSRKGYLYLPFHLPHDPFHRPSADLYDTGTWTCADQVASPQSGAGIVPYYKAMQEAFDTWTGRIWDSIPASLQAETVIFVSSDNGSDVRVLSNENYADGSSYNGGHGKRTSFDPGLRTPAYAYSPNTDFVAAPNRSVTGLIQSLDWFATTLDAFGVPWQEIVEKQKQRVGKTAVDRSKSFWGSLTANVATTDRAYAIGGIFSPNGFNRGTAAGTRWITDGRYKLRFPVGGVATDTPTLWDIQSSPKEDSVVSEPVGTPHPKRTELLGVWEDFYDGLPPLAE